MLKKTMMDALVVAVLVVTAAHAAPLSCEVAGQYDGKYNGPDDHGFVRVNVSVDGTMKGEGQSQQSGATFVIGGVINSDGTLTTDGSVSSGAQFTGRFLKGGMASGMWRNRVSINGTPRMLSGGWGVQRTAGADGCQ